MISLTTISVRFPVGPAITATGRGGPPSNPGRLCADGVSEGSMVYVVGCTVRHCTRDMPHNAATKIRRRFVIENMTGLHRSIVIVVAKSLHEGKDRESRCPSAIACELQLARFHI